MLLFQLPPNFKADAERLGAFLDVVPAGTPLAWEFRHASWHEAGIHDLLGERGMAVVCADTEDSDGDEPIVSNGSWGYLRLRRPGYEDDDLQRWADRLRDTGWARAFVFFKHEDEGAGPRMAGRFREIFEGGA